MVTLKDDGGADFDSGAYGFGERVGGLDGNVDGLIALGTFVRVDDDGNLRKPFDSAGPGRLQGGGQFDRDHVRAVAQDGLTYLDGEFEFARAVTALEERALVPHAEAAIKYANEFRSYVTTYTTGRSALATHLTACAGPHASDEARWRCFEDAMLRSRL